MPGLFQHITELIGKNAAVPQRPLVNVLLGDNGIWFFLERPDLGDGRVGSGQDISIFFGWVGRLDAHQHQIGFPFIRLGSKIFQGDKIAVIHIWVNRADDYAFLRADPCFVHQVSTGQRNGREGVPSARFHRNHNLSLELIKNGRQL